MKRAIAMADNCIDVYYKMDRYYLTGNSIDFALNYKSLGGDVTEMTVLGNDVFADALVERLAQRGIPLRVLKRVDAPPAWPRWILWTATKSIWNSTAMLWRRSNWSRRISILSVVSIIVYCERWTRMARYIRTLRRPGTNLGIRFFAPAGPARK